MKFLSLIILSIALFVLSARPVGNDIKQPKKSTASLGDSGKISMESAYVAEVCEKYFKELVSVTKLNGSILVAQNGQILYEKSSGYANFQTKEKLKIESVFQLASVTKQFTSVSVMMLKEMGLINYDDTVQKFYPKFPYKNITVRMLLTHRSGLPDYTYFSGKYHTDKETPLTNQKLMQIMEQNKPAKNFDPNSRYKYSNTGYAVLGAIIEKVSGMRYQEFVYQFIFKPLGMKSSFAYDPDNFNQDSLLTTGYDRNNKELKKSFLDGVQGDKGIYSTLHDLLLWDEALYTDKLVKQSTLKEAFEPGSTDRKGFLNYGFGFRLRTLADGNRIVYHGGKWNGYNSLVLHLIDKHIAIIFLTNRRNMSFLHGYPQLLGKLKLTTDTLNDEMSTSEGEMKMEKLAN